MEYIVTSDTFPGYWGAGTSEEEAIKNFRRSGGRKPGFLIECDPFYTDCWVDGLATVRGTATDLDRDMNEWPPIIKAAWEYKGKTKVQTNL